MGGTSRHREDSGKKRGREVHKTLNELDRQNRRIEIKVTW